MERTFLLTIDLEEFDRASGDAAFDLSRKGAENLLEVLSSNGVSATFFTTSTFASRSPDIIKSIAEKHEIALHAYNHTHNYKNMDPEEAKEHLANAKNILEEMTGREIIGFRAPQMQAPEMNLLRDIGISYDSSLHPTFVPGRYSHHRESMDIHKDGVVRVPVSVTPRFRLAYSWLWFRVGGVWYAKMCTRSTMKKMDFVSIYFHPWDFVDIRKISGLPFMYARNTHRSPGMLDTYLKWLKGEGFRFMSMGDYLKEKGWL